jgi:hypothetical protein
MISDGTIRTTDRVTDRWTRSSVAPHAIRAVVWVVDRVFVANLEVGAK